MLNNCHVLPYYQFLALPTAHRVRILGVASRHLDPILAVLRVQCANELRAGRRLVVLVGRPIRKHVRVLRVHVLAEAGKLDGGADAAGASGRCAEPAFVVAAVAVVVGAVVLARERAGRVADAGQRRQAKVLPEAGVEAPHEVLEVGDRAGHETPAELGFGEDDGYHECQARVGGVLPAGNVEGVSDGQDDYAGGGI